jgi:hypothetical protein
MTLESLAKLGQQMREAQRRYFRLRTTGALEHSKEVERRFDQACQDALDQPLLFDREPEERS